jgi:hypothetical protein
MIRIYCSKNELKMPNFDPEMENFSLFEEVQTIFNNMCVQMNL